MMLPGAAAEPGPRPNTYPLLKRIEHLAQPFLVHELHLHQTNTQRRWQETEAQQLNHTRDSCGRACVLTLKQVATCVAGMAQAHSCCCWELIGSHLYYTGDAHWDTSSGSTSVDAQHGNSSRCLLVHQLLKTKTNSITHLCCLCLLLCLPEQLLRVQLGPPCCCFWLQLLLLIAVVAGRQHTACSAQETISIT